MYYITSKPRQRSDLLIVDISHNINFTFDQLSQFTLVSIRTNAVYRQISSWLDCDLLVISSKFIIDITNSFNSLFIVICIHFSRYDYLSLNKTLISTRFQSFKLEFDFSMMLSKLFICETHNDESEKSYIKFDNVVFIVFNHLVLILKENEENVKIVLLTFFLDKNFKNKQFHIQKQHISIWSSSRHSQFDEQLHLEVSNTCKNCYLKVHENWWMSKFLFYVNIDSITRSQLKMTSEFFDYVLKAVAEYEELIKRHRASDLSWAWHHFKIKRSFLGFLNDFNHIASTWWRSWTSTFFTLFLPS